MCFMDCDGSLDPASSTRGRRPVAAGAADLVLGARVRRAGSVAGARSRSPTARSRWRLQPPHAASQLTRSRGRCACARRGAAARARASRDRRFGWPLEMVVRAAAAGLADRRGAGALPAAAAGRSKVTGTVRGSLRAAIRHGPGGAVSRHDRARQGAAPPGVRRPGSARRSAPPQAARLAEAALETTLDAVGRGGGDAHVVALDGRARRLAPGRASTWSHQRGRRPRPADRECLRRRGRARPVLIGMDSPQVTAALLDRRPARRLRRRAPTRCWGWPRTAAGGRSGCAGPTPPVLARRRHEPRRHRRPPAARGWTSWACAPSCCRRCATSTRSTTPGRWRPLSPARPSPARWPWLEDQLSRGAV